MSEDYAYEKPQPGEDEAEVVAEGGEHDVGSITVTTFEMTAAEVAVALHVAGVRWLIVV